MEDDKDPLAYASLEEFINATPTKPAAKKQKISLRPSIEGHCGVGTLSPVELTVQS